MDSKWVKWGSKPTDWGWHHFLGPACGDRRAAGPVLLFGRLIALHAYARNSIQANAPHLFYKHLKVVSPLVGGRCLVPGVLAVP